MVRHGCTDLPLTDRNKEKAIQDVMVGEVLTTRTAALDAFFSGLNALGLGAFLRANNCMASIVFPAVEDVHVDVDLMEARFEKVPQELLETEEQSNAYNWFFSFLRESDGEIGINFIPFFEVTKQY